MLNLDLLATTTVDDSLQTTFYGGSFISNHLGAKVEEANRTDQTVLVHRCDLDRIPDYRERWGVYRDCRPDPYGALTTLDGRVG